MQELEKHWKMEEEPGCGGELLLAVGAGEVVRVVDLAAEPQRLTVDDGAEEKRTFLTRCYS